MSAHSLGTCVCLRCWCLPMKCQCLTAESACLFAWLPACASEVWFLVAFADIVIPSIGIYTYMIIYVDINVCIYIYTYIGPSLSIPKNGWFQSEMIFPVFTGLVQDTRHARPQMSRVPKHCKPIVKHSCKWPGDPRGPKLDTRDPWRRLFGKPLNRWSSNNVM